MQKTGFDQAVGRVVEKDGRFDSDAYHFLRDALDYTLKDLRGEESEEHKHVNGRELMDGFRRHALNEFGPMTATVLEKWGLKSTEDIGIMVFQLIEAGAFGKSDADSMADFVGVYTFDKAFRAPYRPQKHRPVRVSLDAVESGAAASGRENRPASPAGGPPSSASAISSSAEEEERSLT